MIVSAIPGRIRLRLTDTAGAHAMARTLADTAGVLETVLNPRTGSLLVRYDPSLLSLDRLKPLLGGAAPSSPPPGNTHRRRADTMRLVKRGMLVSLGISLLLGAADRKTAHIASGAAFVALLGYHLYVYRKRLLA